MQSYRLAFSTVETIVATVLLGIVVALVGQFSGSVRSGIRDRQLSQRLRWELENVREVISSWPVAEVTQERIETLAISSELEKELEEPRWVATIGTQPLLKIQKEKPSNQAGAEQTESQPDAPQPDAPQPDAESESESELLQATSVKLQLSARYKGQMIKPVELTFWLLPTSSVGGSQ
jgi:type II secretory pathway pseudopilin PulG